MENFIEMDDPIRFFKTGKVITSGMATCTAIILHNTMKGIATLIHASSEDPYGGYNKMMNDIFSGAAVNPDNLLGVKAALIGGRNYYIGDVDYQEMLRAAEQGRITEKTFHSIHYPNFLYALYGRFRGRGITSNNIETGIIKKPQRVVYNIDMADFEPPLKENNDILII
jgi:copper oxidase (laccase) domain-containing protein